MNDDIIIRSQQRFRSDHHRAYKIALSSNYDKRIQTFDKVTTYPYGTNVFKLCEGEMLLKNKSHVLRSKSQILRNKSWILRSDSQARRSESQVIRSESQALRSKSQAHRSESQALRK